MLRQVHAAGALLTWPLSEGACRLSCLCTEQECGVVVMGTAGMMNAVSGDKAPDKSQGELAGLLKAMGYTSEQVYKF